MNKYFQLLKDNIRKIGESATKAPNTFKVSLKLHLLQVILACIDSLYNLELSDTEEVKVGKIKTLVCSVSHSSSKQKRLNESLPPKFNFMGSINNEEYVSELLHQVNSQELEVTLPQKLSDAEYQSYAKAVVDRIISGEMLSDNNASEAEDEEDYPSNY